MDNGCSSSESASFGLCHVPRRDRRAARGVRCSFASLSGRGRGGTLKRESQHALKRK